MASDFLIAAGQVIGGVISLVVIFGAFRFGGTYKTLIGDVGHTKESCGEIKQTLADHSPRLQKIEQTLHGPMGDNGMYGAVTELQESVREIIDRRTGPPTRRKAVKRKLA